MVRAVATDRGGVDDLTKEFLAESLEGLDRMERCLTELELRPMDGELLGEIFRSVHTIKGTTGFLGFGRLEKLAHAGEHLLGMLRDGKLVADVRLIDGLLKLMDGLRAILRLIEATGGEGTRQSDEDAALIALLGELGGEPRAKSALAEPTQVEVAGGAGAGGTASEKTLRVDVDVLNRMMNLVGELVLTRNQMLQSHLEASKFAELARRLDTVTADLRETVMQARMQPVGHLFGKFPRMIRDVAKSCGKQVRAEFYGQSTGLDKSLLEAIKDPLTHAIRNAIDHGIETPAVRLAAGKDAEGVLSLRAFHQSGSVVVEVVDDGGGIPAAKVLAKAIERGLITEDQAAAMSRHEVLQLIFLPGFSTASAVTTVSGRGVGMDVVRANVEGAGGTVEVTSDEGKGTVLRLRVPLTLAIVPALVITSAGHSFCVPQGALVELVYVSAAEAAATVDRIGDAEFLRLRDLLLPLVRLDRMLGLAAVEGRRGFHVVVLETERARFGLVVDDLLTPEEIVVKPLSEVLRGIGLYSGATVLGNGQLAIILDVAAIAARARVKAAEQGPVRAAEQAQAKGPAFLVYEDRSRGLKTERKALPLDAVERIESIPVEAVEFAGGKMLLQYRGELLPLDDAGDVLARTAPDQSVTVLICRPNGGQPNDARRVGVVVSQVIDVADGNWMAGQLALVQEKVTVVHEGFTPIEEWRAVA